MQRMVLAVFVGLLFVLGSSFISYSATEGQVAIEGKVVQVSPELITLDLQKGLFSRVNLEINSDTRYDAFVSLQDIEKGDQVKVEYFEKDGKKIAAHIEEIQNAMDKDGKG